MTSPQENSPKETLRINIIVAADANRGIGLKGTLPWHLPSESKYYHGMINHVSSPEKQNAVIFGRISYESIHDPADYAKLLKVVITKQAKSTSTTDDNLRFVGSLQEAVALIQTEKLHRQIETVWSLGGAGIYQETLLSPLLHRVYLTQVLAEFTCDTHFPQMDFSKFQIVQDARVPTEIQKDNNVQFQVKIYERIE